MQKESLIIKGFDLLSEDKLERALNNLGEGATEESILAEYDKLGGGVKRNGRKIAMGTFYDFTEKKPRKNVDYVNLTEDDMEDEIKIVRKKKARPTTEENFAKVRKNLQKAINQKTEDDTTARPKAKSKKAKSE